MKLATALMGVGNGGRQVFRGTHDGSRINEFQFWSPDPDYAAQYGSDLLEAEVADDAALLDLRECVDADGDYDGAAIEAACPGLAEAMGIDAETIIGREQLWDCSRDEHASAVACVRAAGYQGWIWWEGNGDDEAYCLFVD